MNEIRQAFGDEPAQAFDNGDGTTTLVFDKGPEVIWPQAPDINRRTKNYRNAKAKGAADRIAFESHDERCEDESVWKPETVPSVLREAYYSPDTSSRDSIVGYADGWNA